MYTRDGMGWSLFNVSSKVMLLPVLSGITLSNIFFPMFGNMFLSLFLRSVLSSVMLPYNNYNFNNKT